MKTLLHKLRWLDILRSPFKFPNIILHFGKIKKSTPYFLPRHLKLEGDRYVYKDAKWFKVDIVGLRWKDKFNSPRFEFNPIWSLVICNRQLAITFVMDNRIWESYLTYKYYISGNQSTLYRLRETRKFNPNVWVSRKDGTEERIDYFLKSLNKKWYNILKNNKNELHN